jgi:hypothetical protein
MTAPTEIQRWIDAHNGSIIGLEGGQMTLNSLPKPHTKIKPHMAGDMTGELIDFAVGHFWHFKITSLTTNQHHSCQHTPLRRATTAARHIRAARSRFRHTPFLNHPAADPALTCRLSPTFRKAEDSVLVLNLSNFHSNQLEQNLFRIVSLEGPFVAYKM